MPTRLSLEDITSERFIHLDLAKRAELVAQEVREGWKKTQRVEPFAITWPASALKGDDGATVDQAAVCRIPPDFDDERRLDTLRKMVERTKAYGLVLVLPRPDRIHVLFETSQGARAWVMKLERHGDVTACLPPAVRDNAECVGLLWKPAHAS